MDEVQMIVTSADEVRPHVQTVTTYAADFDEVQTIELDADDIDEKQYVYTDVSNTIYESQVLPSTRHVVSLLDTFHIARRAQVVIISHVF